MKRVSIFGVVLSIFGVSSAHAANFAAIITPPGFMSIIVAAVAVASTLGCWKVFSLVKGGFLGKSWLMFTGACALFGLSQLLHFFAVLELFSLPSFIVPLLLAGSAGLIFYGVMETRKTLG
ncbi:MAG: hypothetical protein AAB305_03185 [Candidatus Zixiibacteriota bacterium]